jgi:glycosyltransferase involved in cell wall biosynthesis
VVRVLVDALPLRYGGGAHFLSEQLGAFARVAPQLDLRVLRSPWTEIEGAPGRVETVRVRSVIQRFAYEQTVLPLRRADVLYCAANFGPLLCRMPSVITVHSPNYYGAALTLAEVAASRPPWKVRANHLAIKRADLVVVVSESLARAVVETLPKQAAKIRVVPCGSPTWPDTSLPIAGLPDRFLLSVASSAPHKQVSDIVAAWAALPAENADLALVLVGGHTASEMDQFRRIAGAATGKLLTLGVVDDRRHMKWLYENATAFVSMTLLETFHLPVVEAGSVGCPLVLSDLPVHREVAGQNAMYVDPRDVTALTRILEVAARGFVPGSRPWTWPWTWDDNALAYAQLFESVVA